MAIGIPGETVRAGGGQVATGQQYAQQIAGGMPMSQVIAPGVSYSPEQPGGYTQADLNMISTGTAPVMPIAPTTGEVATIPNQMPYAPPGTTIADLIPNDLIQNYLQFIPNLGLPSDIPFQDIAADTSFAPELSQDGNFFVPSKFDLDVEAILEGVDPEKLAEIDLSNIDLPDSRGRPGIDYFPEPRDPFIVSDFFDLPGQAEVPSLLAEPTPAPVVAPVMPQAPVYQAPAPTPAPIVQQAPVMPSFPIQQPMNFTGLPQVPVMPEPIMQKPVIPQVPINIPNIPMNFTGLPNIPVPPTAQVYIPPPPPAYTQPRVEDIISPIRSGSPRNFQQPGLFNLV
tara:strand:- start:4757 stop:5776 length:1020 start_codon:yes stop_codon:yes gene_type:complete